MFNLFNLRRTLDYNNNVDFPVFGVPNPDYGTPTSANVAGQQFQRPFQVRLGIRYAFQRQGRRQKAEGGAAGGGRLRSPRCRVPARCERVTIPAEGAASEGPGYRRDSASARFDDDPRAAARAPGFDTGGGERR